MNENQQGERRRFRMHPNLLWSVIERQSGSIEKAVMEAVMNSIDAGSTSIDIRISGTELSVTDNGRGFASRGEIEDFFETFGHPHEQGDATYGRFRMGRGQLMAKGVCVWTSNRWRMEVDLRVLGLDYRLVELEEKDKVAGCSVRVVLYESLNSYAQAMVEREIEKFVRYAPCKVTLNNAVLTGRSEMTHWNETAEALFNVRRAETGNVLVYNLGVFTQEISAFQCGLSGTVVSKKELRVNFARNEVLPDCPVMKGIRRELASLASVEAKKKRVLTDAERSALIRRIEAKDIDWQEFDRVGLLRDTSGRAWSIHSIRAGRRFVRDAKGRITVSLGEDGNRVADRLLQTGIALVLSERILDALPRGTSRDDAFEIMLGGCLKDQVRYRAFEDLARGLVERFDIVTPAELTPREKAITRAVEEVLRRVATGLAEHDVGDPCRRVSVGVSEVAAAWTDGRTFVALEREFLKGLLCDFSGIVKLVNTVLHEMCHGEEDAGTHEHSPTFYQMYHDVSVACGGAFIQEFIAIYRGLLAAEKKRLPKTLAWKVGTVEDLGMDEKRLGWEQVERAA